MKKVLIIDDEVDFCLLLKAYLTRHQYQVYYAHTLRDGIEQAKKISPEIIFLDNNLPDGKGWECVEEILTKKPSLKLYLISAYRQKVDLGYTSPNLVLWEKPISLSLLEGIF